MLTLNALPFIICKFESLEDGEIKPWFWFLIQRAERETSPGIEGLNLSNFDSPMAPPTEFQDVRY